MNGDGASGAGLRARVRAGRRRQVPARGLRRGIAAWGRVRGRRIGPQDTRRGWGRGPGLARVVGQVGARGERRGSGGRPATRASPHCAEGATEANARLKVAPPAKVARVSGSDRAVPRPGGLGHHHLLKLQMRRSRLRLRGYEMLPKCPTFRKYLAALPVFSAGGRHHSKSPAALPVKTQQTLPS